MNTRRAIPGSPIRQERWASDPVEGRGILANLIQPRFERGSDHAMLDLVWWIQARSWTPGGLERLAHEIAERDDGSIYSWLDEPHWLKLAGRNLGRDEWPPLPGEDNEEDKREFDFDTLVSILSEYCVRGKSSRWTKAMAEVAQRIRGDEHAAAQASLAQTEPVRQSWVALDQCAAKQSVLLLEGPARTGKTAAAKAWCNADRGHRRYVATPHGNDLDPLFRAIASAIGTASGLSFKGRQVEERIFRALPASGLTLVFDDAWNLWPQGDTRQSHPRRLQWLLSLIDSGVGVALVSTRQWWDCRRAFIAQTGWVVDQLDGRIGDVVELPNKLTPEDGAAVASSLVPEASAEIWKVLGHLAVSSARRLGAMEAVAREAARLAKQGGREKPNEGDFREAIEAAIRVDRRFTAERPPATTSPRRESGDAVVGMAPAKPRSDSGRGGLAPSDRTGVKAPLPSAPRRGLVASAEPESNLVVTGDITTAI